MAKLAWYKFQEMIVLSCILGYMNSDFYQLQSKAY
jgi:hypothetical protein